MCSFEFVFDTFCSAVLSDISLIFYVKTAGTVFENVNLSGGDWVDYDENGSMPVSVDNLKSRFDVVKSR